MKIEIKNFELNNFKENKEEFQFEKGKVYNGKIIESKDGEIQLLFKGMKINVNSNLDLNIGENIEFFFEKIENENIFLKIIGNNQKNNQNNFIENEIIDILKENKVLFNKEKIDAINDIYNEIIENDSENSNNKNVDKALIKTIIFLEENKLDYDIKLLKNLYSYYNKEKTEKIDINKELKENIEKTFEKIKESQENYDKGMNIVNAFNKKNNLDIIEFSIFLYELKESIDIKIKKDEKKDENGETKPDLYVNLKMEFEKFGKMEIKLNNYKKIINAVFLAEKNYDILENNINVLKEKLKNIGFQIGSIGVKQKNVEIEDKNNKGVNIKI